MNTALFDKLMNDTLMNSSNNIKQKIINKIIERNIGTYKKNQEDKICLKNLTLDEKVKKCIENYPNTFKIFDEVEFNKGYRYSFVYKYNNIDMKTIKNNAYNMDDIDYENILESKKDINLSIPYYIEDNEKMYIKFHKSINEVEIKDEMINKYDRRYSTMIVVHKNQNIIDIRFDKLTHKKDDDFYEKALELQISWIKSKLNCDLEDYELGIPMTYIVNNCSNQVVEDICSLGFEQSKGVVVNYGKSKVMPLIGELELLIEENLSKFDKDQGTKECKKLLEDYIFDKKILSSKHYRVLRWLNEENNLDKLTDSDVKVKVIFNYKENNRDLVCFLDSKNNNMETMNYVVRYIKSVENDC